MALRMIVGLGNPGPRYRGTRHNVGFDIVERLASGLNTPFAREYRQGLVAEAEREGPLWLVKPLTFMNRSGDCVAQITRNKVPDLERLLVIVDDVHLPLGRLRIRPGGSAGGHNGLRSLIERLGTEDFPRLRVGIGKAGGGPLVDHVLGRFAPDERPLVEESVARAAEAVLCFLDHGLQEAMNAYNGG